MQAGKRHIKSGAEYDKYFGKATQINIDLPKSDVYQTLNFMEKLVKDTISQTSKIAFVLKGKSLHDTCKNIFDFIYQHIQYKPDQFGVEQLRTPNRTWADRKTGVDCDCYSIFISSILSNLGIPHAYRITKYDGKTHFQHVYVIVPKNGKNTTARDTYYVIDPVLDTYNDEKIFSEKFDKAMKIPHQILNGVADNPQLLPFGQEFDHLGGLGSTDENFLQSLKAHLQNTLDQLNRNPKAFSSAIDPITFKEQIEYVLENWNDPVAREGALEEMAEMEDLGENLPETSLIENTVNGFGNPLTSPILARKRTANLSTEGARKKVKLLRQRRSQQKRVVPATIQRGTLKTDKKFNMECTCHMRNGVNGYYASPLMGLNGLDGFFKKIGSAIKTTVKKVGSTVKKVANKVGETAKTVGKGIVKYNPLTIAARNGLLVVLKLNLFGLAKNLKYGYLTESQARAKNMNILEWRKVKDTLHKTENLFKSIGGNPENLKNAILKGKAGGLNGLGEVATATAVTASTGLVATITAWLKKIDFKKLFNTAKSVVSTTKQVRQVFQPQTSTSPSVIAQPIPMVSQPNEEYMPTYTLPEHTVVATRDEPKKSNTGLIVGVAIAGVLGAVLLGKKKGEALNGVVQSVSI